MNLQEGTHGIVDCRTALLNAWTDMEMAVEERSCRVGKWREEKKKEWSGEKIAIL
jgi:hypothetical protein